MLSSEQGENMRIVRLKEVWDMKNSSFVIKDRFTEVGMTTYWAAVDTSVKFNIKKGGCCRQNNSVKNLSIQTHLTKRQLHQHHM